MPCDARRLGAIVASKCMEGYGRAKEAESSHPVERGGSVESKVGGAMLIWEVCLPSGEVQSWAAAKGHLWILGPAAAVVCADVPGSCYHLLSEGCEDAQSSCSHM